jgi:hypothetical protein
MTPYPPALAIVMNPHVPPSKENVPPTQKKIHLPVSPKGGWVATKKAVMAALALK